MPQFALDPNGIETFSLDWEDWLGTDTINTSTWILPAQLTEDAESETTTTTSIKLSVGTGVIGEIHRATNDIVTVTGVESPRRSIYIHIEVQ